MSSQKRIAIFAHYDKDNIIDDYVIYYLNALKDVAQKIIFVSDCDLPFEEQNKLQGIVDKVIAYPHGEYDFGSYKSGFLFALENDLLKETDECIFVNDSCYGPFNSLKSVFEEMERKDSDFWALTKNDTGFVFEKGKYLVRKRPHFQSYFLVLKRKIFLSNLFIDFIKSVKKEKNKFEIIINYEIKLSEILSKNNFKGEGFVNIDFYKPNLTILKWKDLILKHNMPFLKCSLPRHENLQYTVIKGYEEIIKKISNYPIELIHKNVERNLINKDFLYFLPEQMRIFSYKLIFFVKKLKLLTKNKGIFEKNIKNKSFNGLLFFL